MEIINLQGNYNKIGVIGEGAFGKVVLFEAKPDKIVPEKEKKVVLKIIDKTKLSDEIKKDVLEEVKFCTILKHKNIISCFGGSETDSKVFILLEYANGGDLFEDISERDYTEEKTRKVMKDILSALEYCHSMRICNHDLKLENILIFKSSEGITYKIADWGLIDRTDRALTTTKGTIFYMAPEIIVGKAHFCDQTDMWAVGCMAYACTQGVYPFGAKYSDQKMSNDVYSKIMECILKDEVIYSKKMTDEYRNFVERLLDRNPKTRMTATQALNHPWITEKKEELTEFSITNTNDKSLKFPKNLKKISIRNLFELESIDELPEGLETLQFLNCPKLKNLPSLPDSLKSLSCRNCKKLVELPVLPQGVQQLDITQSVLLFIIPKLPETLKIFACDGCYMRKLPELSPTLEKLSCGNCANIQEISGLPDSLKILICIECPSLETISKLPPQLKEFFCDNCPRLKSSFHLPKTLEEFSCNGSPNIGKITGWRPEIDISSDFLLDTDE